MLWLLWRLINNFPSSPFLLFYLCEFILIPLLGLGYDGGRSAWASYARLRFLQHLFLFIFTLPSSPPSSSWGCAHPFPMCATFIAFAYIIGSTTPFIQGGFVFLPPPYFLATTGHSGYLGNHLWPLVPESYRYIGNHAAPLVPFPLETTWLPWFLALFVWGPLSLS